MRENIFFSYDGKYSQDFGIYNVSMRAGMFEETFVAPRKLKEVTLTGSRKPYFQGIELEPLEFTLEFAFADKWNDELIREVARWLSQDYYKPLWFSNSPDRIYYAIMVDDSNLIHNGCKQGYITLKMRCDSPYTYSPIFTKTFDFSDVTSGTFSLTNAGDVDCMPEIEIVSYSAGNLVIRNVTDNSREFKFTALDNNETVYIDNENQFISTDKPNFYRYDSFNNNYLRVIRGVNNFTVEGKCKLTFRYQLKTIQG